MDSDITNRIVQINGSRASYSVIVVEKFKVKIVHAIYHMAYKSSNMPYFINKSIFAHLLLKSRHFFTIHDNFP